MRLISYDQSRHNAIRNVRWSIVEARDQNRMDNKGERGG